MHVCAPLSRAHIPETRTPHRTAHAPLDCARAPGLRSAAVLPAPRRPLTVCPGPLAQPAELFSDLHALWIALKDELALWLVARVFEVGGWRGSA